MSGSSYRNFLQLLKIWPKDPTKVGGRDLGEYIRKRIVTDFPRREATAVNEEQCNAVWASLNRIANDTYKNKYPRKYNSSALGLSKEECTGLLSNEFQTALAEKNQSYTSKFKGLFKRKK